MIVPGASKQDRKEIQRLRSEAYEREYLDRVVPFADVRDMFRALRTLGSEVALVTDCKALAFKRDLSLLNFGEFIAGTAWSDDVEHGKPDPRLSGHALCKLGVRST